MKVRPLYEVRRIEGFEEVGDSPYDIQVVSGPRRGLMIYSGGLRGLGAFSPSAVRTWQTTLHERGVGSFVGTIDGDLGPRTFNAMTYELGPRWPSMNESYIT